MNYCAGFRSLDMVMPYEVDGVSRENFNIVVNAEEYGLEPTETPRIDKLVSRNIELGLAALGGERGPIYDRIVLNAGMVDHLLGCDGAEDISLAIDRAREGIDRLGFVIDFLSKVTLVGFMASAAVIVSLQQLKGLLGIVHFTNKMQIVPVISSIFKQKDEILQWSWQTIVMGVGFLVFLLTTRTISMRKPKFFWVLAGTPLLSVIFSTLLVFLLKSKLHKISTVRNGYLSWVGLELKLTTVHCILVLKFLSGLSLLFSCGHRISTSDLKLVVHRYFDSGA